MKETECPLVSIILPCYNCEQYIEETLDSIINQTYINLEIIIVNDGSTDSTDNIIRKYASIDKRIIYVNNEANLKLPTSLNKALKICSGDYIARIDSDDICMRERIEKQLEYMEKYKDIDIIGSDILSFYENKGRKHKLSNPKEHRGIINKMFLSSPLFHPTVFFRRRLIDDNIFHYSDEFHRIEDYHLWVNLHIHGVIFGNIDIPLVKYRISEESETKLGEKNYLDKLDKLVKIYNVLFQKYDIRLSMEDIKLYSISLNRAWCSLIDEPIKLLDIYIKIISKKPDLAIPLYKRWLLTLLLSKNVYYKFRAIFSLKHLSYIRESFKKI